MILLFIFCSPLLAKRLHKKESALFDLPIIFDNVQPIKAKMKNKKSEKESWNFHAKKENYVDDLFLSFPSSINQTKCRCYPCSMPSELTKSNPSNLNVDLSLTSKVIQQRQLIKMLKRQLNEIKNKHQNMSRKSNVNK